MRKRCRPSSFHVKFGEKSLHVDAAGWGNFTFCLKTHVENARLCWHLSAAVQLTRRRSRMVAVCQLSRGPVLVCAHRYSSFSRQQKVMVRRCDRACRMLLLACLVLHSCMQQLLL